jgi:hypothetical protein
MMEPLRPASGEPVEPALQPSAQPDSYHDADHSPIIAYCVTPEAAEAHIRDVIRDAAGWPLCSTSRRRPLPPRRTGSRR